MPEDAVVEPVVEPVAEPVTEPVAEPVADAPVVEPEKHPLEPGGARFKEVYARAKTAEAKMQEEREGRIRAETEAAVLREARSTQLSRMDEKIPSWAELKQRVANGEFTEDVAFEYRLSLERKAAAKEAEASITAKLDSRSRLDRVASEIERYKDAIPDVNKLGTDERAKFDTEFRYQVDVVGLDPKSTATQLTALRAVYGSPDKAVQYAKAHAKAAPAAESYAETSGGGSAVPATPKKAFRDTLTPREQEHYDRMIKHGRYGDPATAWARIKEEHDYFNTVKGIS